MMRMTLVTEITQTPVTPTVRASNQIRADAFHDLPPLPFPPRHGPLVAFPFRIGPGGAIRLDIRQRRQIIRKPHYGISS